LIKCKLSDPSSTTNSGAKNMILKATGKINNTVSAAGHYIYPGYMIKGKKKNLMIEAGINILGPSYLKDLNRFFNNGDELDYILVTQSHYDHLGALSFLKRALPHVKTGAAPRVGKLMQKPSVIKTMNFLSDQLGDYFKDEIPVTEDNIQITPMAFDMALKEGDVIELGGISCHVYETPGHTRDHLSFFIPELSMLFPGEALGNPAGDGTEVKVEFVTSYSDYMASIEKLVQLNPDIIAMSHMYVYTEEDAHKHMDRTILATRAYRQLIEIYLDQAQGEIKDAVDLMVKVEYDQKGEILMERNAYIANLNAQVAAVHAAGQNC